MKKLGENEEVSGEMNGISGITESVLNSITESVGRIESLLWELQIPIDLQDYSIRNSREFDKSSSLIAEEEEAEKRVSLNLKPTLDKETENISKMSKKKKRNEDEKLRNGLKFEENCVNKKEEEKIGIKDLKELMEDELEEEEVDDTKNVRLSEEERNEDVNIKGESDYKCELSCIEEENFGNEEVFGNMKSIECVGDKGEIDLEKENVMLKHQVFQLRMNQNKKHRGNENVDSEIHYHKDLRILREQVRYLASELNSINPHLQITHHNTQT